MRRRRVRVALVVLIGVAVVVAVLVLGCKACERDEEPEPRSDVSETHADTDEDTDEDTDAGAEIVAPEPDTPADAPSVEVWFTYPDDGAAIAWDQLVAVGVESASPAVVRFEIDGQEPTIDEEEPFVAEFRPDVAREGERVVRALATADGVEAQASITLFADRTPPEVEILSPNSDLNGPTGGMLPVVVRAEDAGGVATVEIFVDGPGLEPVVLEAPPWETEFEVSGLPLGVFSVSATARDRAGRERMAGLDFITCPPDREPCGGICRLPETLADDPEFCGACDVRCDVPVERCVDGACVCAPGWTDCDGTCVNLQVDARACGACGVACPESQGCVAGTCADDVPPGFVLLPSGTFSMGAPPTEFGAGPGEVVHEVTLSRAFLFQRHEVTQSEWGRFFDVDPSHFWDCGDSCPVDSVSWWEAAAYANALSDAEGYEPCYVLGGCSGVPGAGLRCTSVFVNGPGQSPPRCVGYRLPTEAEWEYAYRAGTTTPTYNGAVRTTVCEHVPHLAEIAWFDCNSAQRTHRVGELRPNGFGVYDMAGNVAEWVWDYWSAHSPTPATDPLGGTIENHPFRMVKGGTWVARAPEARAAARVSENGDAGSPLIGFRVVRTFSP